MTSSANHWLRTPSGKKRARALGLKVKGTPGPFNAITDIAGVEVGYSTIIEGAGALSPGKGPIRTGVTAILPRGKGKSWNPVMAGVHSFNGNGELTGSHWVEESGFLETPITITNSHSVGICRDSTAKWMVEHYGTKINPWQLPMAGETFDGVLNDINGFHVKEHHVFEALNNATSGPIEMGSIGGGTGMLTYEFKGGSSSASREMEFAGEKYRVGVFVQSNFGRRPDLEILGVPIGNYFPEHRIVDEYIDEVLNHNLPSKTIKGDLGSMIAVIATDAPLMPHQLKRLAQRVPMGMARTGTYGGNGSGDIFVAFSTANEHVDFEGTSKQSTDFLSNEIIDPLFLMTVQATEEAILDAMIVNQDMIGINDRKAIALPHDKLMEVIHAAKVI